MVISVGRRDVEHVSRPPKCLSSAYNIPFHSTTNSPSSGERRRRLLLSGMRGPGEGQAGVPEDHQPGRVEDGPVLREEEVRVQEEIGKVKRSMIGKLK